MPNRVWAADFAQTLDSIGFEDLYDLCLVPIDPTSGRGKGYAFVNFNTPESAAALCDVLEALPAEHVSGRRLHVAVARIQGAEATLAMRGPPKPGKKRKRWDLFVAPGSLAQRAVQAEEC